MTTYYIEIDGGQGGDCYYDAANMDEACEYAEQWTREGDWDTSEGTIWCDVRITAQRDGDIESTLRSLIGSHSMSEHPYGWWVYAATDLDIEAMRDALPGATMKMDDAGDLDVDIGEPETAEITVQIDADEPACTADEHDWRSPYSVVGGIEENPGVHGHGGGVIITEVCGHCGAYRVTDTWAQRPDTGEQGLTAVAYREADDESSAWLRRRHAALHAS